MSTPNFDAEDLQQAAERFRLVVESSPAAMVIVDGQGVIAMVNRQTENWFGYERDELIGQCVECLVPHRFHQRHVTDCQGFLDAPSARPMGAGHELSGRRKDGTELPVDISLHPMQTKQGMLVMAYIVDLTDRKQAEFEVRKRHSLERLALLGQLAGGVAHEIRNPLGVIRNAAYYLNMVKEALDEEARESVEEILEEVDRANHIVSDLLDYARDSPQRTATFDIVKFVRDLIQERRPVNDELVKLESAVESFNVTADSDQIRRVLENLILNGAQAAEGPATIYISLTAKDQHISIDVRDEGEGIIERDRLRIFEPLFTTKTKGIGLGLAISKRYAERNGGTLDLVDDEGPGASFRLTLPGGGLANDGVSRGPRK